MRLFWGSFLRITPTWRGDWGRRGDGGLVWGLRSARRLRIRRGRDLSVPRRNRGRVLWRLSLGNLRSFSRNAIRLQRRLSERFVHLESRVRSPGDDRRRAVLLDGMSQFMRDQAAAGRSFGAIPVFREEDVLHGRERSRSQLP